MHTPTQDDLAQHSLSRNDVQECPWPHYQVMHEQGIFFDTELDMYVCVNYQMMREIMRNPGLYSSVNSQNVSHMREPPDNVKRLLAAQERPVNILVSADPPEHGRVRNLLDGPFRTREIIKLRPRIQEIVHGVIDDFIDTGTVEVVSQFAVPIPVTVIAELLGLERKYADTIKAWSDAAVEPLGMMISDARWAECAAPTLEFQQFIKQELESRRAEPREDLLTHLVQARDEQGQPLSMGEMLAVTGQLLVAGNETTTNGIAGGIQLLIENPQQQQALRDDETRMHTFVNEALRLESPVQGLFRITTAAVNLGGVDIPAGARIHLRYATANRDGAKYAQPDSLDVCRKNAGTQVGFGAGIHHCLGANLAREEMQQAFTILLRRLDKLSFTADANDFEHHPSLILRGLKQLNMTFEPLEH